MAEGSSSGGINSTRQSAEDLDSSTISLTNRGDDGVLEGVTIGNEDAIDETSSDSEVLNLINYFNQMFCEIFNYCRLNPVSSFMLGDLRHSEGLLTTSHLVFDIFILNIIIDKRIIYCSFKDLNLIKDTNFQEKL
jgi:hypothetical protein